MEQTENKEEFLGKEQMSEFMKGIFELKQYLKQRKNCRMFQGRRKFKGRN